MKSLKRSLASLLITLPALLGAPGAAHAQTGPAEPASLIQLRSYIVTPTGQDQGLFKKAGVDLNARIVTDNLLINEAMSSSTSDLGITGTTYQALAADKLPYSIIAIAEQSPEAVGIIVAKDSKVATLKDLRGKTVAGGDGVPIAYVQKALADVGIGPNDYKYVKIEASAGAAALASNRIDAWISFNPFIANAVSNGLAKILYTPTTKEFNNFVLILATKDAIQKKPEALARFLRGYKDSLGWVQANRAASISIYSKATGLTPDVAGLTFAKRNQKFMAPDDSVVADLSREAKLYIQYGVIKTEPDWKNVTTTEIWQRAFGK